MKPQTIFRIKNRKSGGFEGAYSRACHTEYDFSSPEEARSSNFHEIFRDKYKYAIEKYKVTYTLIDPDCKGGEKCLHRTDKTFQECMDERMISAVTGIPVICDKCGEEI